MTDRTTRLRQQKRSNDRAVADATKQARRSANDPLYQQAQRECGGYDTCVQSRVKKLRSEKTARIDTKTPKTKAQSKKLSLGEGRKLIRAPRASAGRSCTARGIAPRRRGAIPRARMPLH
ncbi:hypothetical protein AB0L88_07225 [Saccharopolyspora shandongensis]|uniref:hypothetical protein n=1 Tax=Saccharopolyspora shandongensis TaxID=418495 RepID=UPI00341A6F58